MKPRPGDVQAELEDGTTVMIEMQAILRPEFFRRVLYNTAKKYSAQLESGEFYGRLKPVISLVIGDFIFAKGQPELLSHFELIDRSRSLTYPAHADFQIVVVELEKFNLSVDQLETVLDMWLYFLQHAEELQEVPEKMADVKEIATAFEAAELANLSPDERIELEKREKYALAKEASLEMAREEAYEAGMRLGIEEGVEQGVIQSVIDVLLSKFDSTPEDLRTRLDNINDLDLLRKATVQAATADALQAFTEWLTTIEA